MKEPSSPNSLVDRRAFLGKSVLSAAWGLLGFAGSRAANVVAAAESTNISVQPTDFAKLFSPEPGLGNGARAFWISIAEKLATPVLTNLAAGTLHANMPVRGIPSRRSCTHLEAFGRLMCGIAPWLEQDRPEKWVKLAQKALDMATDPKSPDFLNFYKGRQPLVDTALLAQAILRAPTMLWKDLEPRVRQNTIAALKSSRNIVPGNNNWVLFASTVEAGLKFMGVQDISRDRVDRALSSLMDWYKGDGFYGDGRNFHMDYYNSIVMHPLLVDTINQFGDDPQWSDLKREIYERAARYAAVQERQISPIGTYPIVGRSITYRFGVFHALAQSVLLGYLPKQIDPAQVRCALSAVIRRQTVASGTFDANGWLNIGVCGHQPALGEGYISTGSEYMCAAGLLPLGLPAAHPFWSRPDAEWTSVQAWSGANIRHDQAIAS
jgi:hypothetical protein